MIDTLARSLDAILIYEKSGKTQDDYTKFTYKIGLLKQLCNDHIDIMSGKTPNVPIMDTIKDNLPPT
ncbi:MAG: hypothetical protein WC783_04230 [Candidatus Paceibacterota bacterium]